jgi:DNA-binding NarL/FixJ family response regulator
MTCSRIPASGPVGLLLVDDDARVRAAIGQTIALETGLVLVGDAADAATALAAVLSLVACTGSLVALVDVLIPDEITGLTLVRSLSQRPDWSVVAMSVRDDLRPAALAAGAAAFVGKGAGIDAILEVIRAAGRDGGMDPTS